MSVRLVGTILTHKPKTTLVMSVASVAMQIGPAVETCLAYTTGIFASFDSGFAFQAEIFIGGSWYIFDFAAALRLSLIIRFTDCFVRAILVSCLHRGCNG